jgi:hypothetical protein
MVSAYRALGAGKAQSRRHVPKVSEDVPNHIEAVSKICVTYQNLQFSLAGTGQHPNTWVPTCGIQNAAYLWKTFGIDYVNHVHDGSFADKDQRAAALEFAV